MRSEKEVALVALLFSSIIISSLTTGFCHEGYPWIHYFAGPEMPRIVSALADAHRNVIVSTGEWASRSYYPSYWVEEYWSEGIFRINCAEIEPISCPDDTYVLDGAVDSQARTWLLFAEGVDIRHYYDRETHACDCTPLDADIGYRMSRYPVGQWNRLQDYRFGRIDQSRFTEQPNLARMIPGRPNVMLSGPRGRVFVVSEEHAQFDHFLSWWDGGAPEVVHTVNMSEIFPPLLSIRDYPVFGPDTLVHFITTYSVYEATRGYKYAILSLDPETEDWEVYDEEDSTFLDSAIEYFAVDDNNVKWFGTEDGLVVFDGSNWERFTTENSGLPYNLVRQIEYDEIDNVYYVVSQTGSPGEYYTAFTILHPDGRSVGASLHFPVTSYAWDLPKIYRDSREILWLVHPYGYELYSYDHERVLHWDTADWMEDPWPVGYIGSDSDGRTFLVTPTCVMIW